MIIPFPGTFTQQGGRFVCKEIAKGKQFYEVGQQWNKTLLLSDPFRFI